MLLSPSNGAIRTDARQQDDPKQSLISEGILHNLIDTNYCVQPLILFQLCNMPT